MRSRRSGATMPESKEVEMPTTVTVELSELPEPQPFEPGIRRAPSRGYRLDRRETILALKNALRYVPEEHHEIVAPELLEELRTMGRIYGYRYRPAGRIWGRPVDQYRGATLEGRAMQVMIDNNLDFDVALYPYELVTYGESGQVCQNWMQYRLIKGYLEMVTQVVRCLSERGMAGVMVLVGGIIPEEDHPRLLDTGVSAIFGPGTPTSDIVRTIRTALGRC